MCEVHTMQGTMRFVCVGDEMVRPHVVHRNEIRQALSLQAEAPFDLPRGLPLCSRMTARDRVSSQPFAR